MDIFLANVPRGVIRNIIMATITMTLTCCAIFSVPVRFWFALDPLNVVNSRKRSEESGSTLSKLSRFAEQLYSSVFYSAAFASSQTSQHKYKMGGCTVISNISVKIKVTADLLYMHLHIIDIVSHWDASTFKMPEIIHLHFLCSLYAIL